jgi:hypothetical protein
MQCYKHSLIIGGTGMLAAATLEVCRQSETTTILSRNAKAFVTENKLPPHFALSIDYTDTGKLVPALKDHISKYGPFDLAVLWMHSTGEESLVQLLDILEENKCAIVHILGSASGDPRQQSNRITQKLGSSQKIIYRRTILGHQETKHGQRWLNHDEISQGVLDTLTGKKDVIVGKL